MNHTSDALTPVDIRELARSIIRIVRDGADTAPSGNDPANLPERRHVTALATVGATALALSRINGSENLAGLVEAVTGNLSELELAQFERLISEALTGLLGARIASESVASAGTSGNTSP